MRSASPSARLRPAPFYRVRDTGIRCVKAPCFFMRAWRLSTTKVVTVSELDLGPAGLTPGQEQAAQEALEPRNGGLFVAGRIVRRIRRGPQPPGVGRLPQPVDASRLSTSQASRTSSSVVR